MYKYSGRKNIKNTVQIKRYFATYIAFSSSSKIKIFKKVTNLDLQLGNYKKEH